MLKVALIGRGAIGRELERHLATERGAVRVVAALVAHPAAHAGAPFAVTDRLQALLDSGPDVVVECARQQALRECGPVVLRGGLLLIAASVGALADRATHDLLCEAAAAGGGQLAIPAGALAGVDALAAARRCGVSSVRYVRRAAPATWVRHGALAAERAAELRQAHVVFEGDARSAARCYPKNANVTATVAIAGVGFEATRVTLIADPAVDANVHEIEAEGAFGVLSAKLSARPISAQTSSSAIVAASLARCVMSRSARIVV
jgi:aspartate dehydrogenase